MALLRAAGLCRLALRTHWASLRLLSSAGAGGEPPAGEDKPGRRVDLEALRRERALRPPSDRARGPIARGVRAGSAGSARGPRGVRSRAHHPAARVSPATPGRLVPPTREQLQLNKELQTCASGEAVLALVSSRLAVLNEVNAATALMTLARRASISEAASLSGDARFAQLIDAAASRFGLMAAQELSNTIYACGQLSIVPPADWLERYWHATASKLGEFKPQNFSNTVYACSQLGLEPPADWLERYWHASVEKLGDFKPQELGNMLYACGQLGITPPADWLPRFWHASAAMLGDFKPQELNNTIYACGQLGVTPSDYWLPRFWQASAAALGAWIAQDLSNTIYACGLLDIRPPADWLPRFSSGCEQALPGMNQQDWANTAFALAMLGLWELPLWCGLWERLCTSISRDIAGWSAEDRLQALQMYQAYQVAAVERPGLLPAPSPELLAAARKSWIDQARERQTESSSRLHDGVSACLTHMGVAHANERWCERSERSIDIAIDGATPVALEVDGPSHFLQDGRLNGRTLLRNRILAAHGWRVAVVDHRAWNAQQTQEQREAYLRHLLA